MSNPAVIVLASNNKKNGEFKRFQIEDNIGESIHLHIDNMRLDFTVKEFLAFSSMVRQSLNKLDFLRGYNLDDFDEHFLSECSFFLPKLKEISIIKMKISDLRCIKRTKFFDDLYLTKLVKIEDTPVYKFLNTNDTNYLKYPQFNYYNSNNSTRISMLRKSITQGYPDNNKYIIIFNGQKIVKDGQHRLAILANLHGTEKEIEVMKFSFSGNRHYYFSFLSNLNKIISWLSKKIYYRFLKN